MIKHLKRPVQGGTKEATDRAAESLKMAKITKATFKSFARKNRDRLYINVKSEFDGYTDGLESKNDGFQKIEADNFITGEDHTLGIKGLWIVNGGGDRFREFDDGEFTGIEYYNACGHGILAVLKTA
jgi:hypothetical protein